MSSKKFDIRQRPIIGYGDASSLSGGNRFKRPDDAELPPRPKYKKALITMLNSRPKDGT